MTNLIETQNPDTKVVPTKEALIAEILYLATVVNFRTNRCVFVDMSGHVDTLHISVRESKKVYQIELAKSETSLVPMDYIKDNPEELAKWHDKLIEKLTTTRDVLESFITDEIITPEYLNEHEQVTKTVLYTF